MENLNKDEVMQLLNYYKGRSVDLEFQLLQAQIKLNRVNVEEPVPAKKTIVEKAK